MPFSNLVQSPLIAFPTLSPPTFPIRDLRIYLAKFAYRPGTYLIWNCSLFLKVYDLLSSVRCPMPERGPLVSCGDMSPVLANRPTMHDWPCQYSAPATVARRLSPLVRPRTPQIHLVHMQYLMHGHGSQKCVQSDVSRCHFHSSRARAASKQRRRDLLATYLCVCLWRHCFGASSYPLPAAR